MTEGPLRYELDLDGHSLTVLFGEPFVRVKTYLRSPPGSRTQK